MEIKTQQTKESPWDEEKNIRKNLLLSRFQTYILVIKVLRNFLINLIIHEEKPCFMRFGGCIRNITENPCTPADIASTLASSLSLSCSLRSDVTCATRVFRTFPKGAEKTFIYGLVYQIVTRIEYMNTQLLLWF